MSTAAQTAPPVPIRFSLADVEAANDAWGCNCGPGAVAAILGMTLDEIRPHLGDFERKGYTNPTLMWSILRSAGAASFIQNRTMDWPSYGLARVQWDGPWTKPGVPLAARYRHTHWVGARYEGAETEIFDINAMSEGGWISFALWRDSLVPWLLGECEPKATGGWWITHSVEVVPAYGATP